MTERLMSIWKRVDRIEDNDIADIVEKSLLDDYLTETKFIIPEEDWYEIQTRGYDIEMMCHDADEEHPGQAGRARIRDETAGVVRGE